MAIDQKKTDAAQDKRAKELAQLLGIHEAEAPCLSLSGRLKIIAKLKAARRVEIARGRAGSWLYDVNRHLSLCAALRQEYTALAAILAEGGADNAASISGATTPHPVPLPLGEGTQLRAPRLIQASLLPWGEGQDEGR